MKLKLKKLSKKTQILLIQGLIIVIVIFLIWFSFIRYSNEFGVSGISPSGLILLDDYEGMYVIDWQTTQDDGFCAEAYDVGDGVITFGLGQTFATEQAGIDYINQYNDTNYQVGDCVQVQDLYALQAEDIAIRNKKIRKLDRHYRMNLNQQQFDAIMLLFYLNEETIYDPLFWEMLQQDDVSKEQYTNYFISRYSQFNQWDQYSAGWTNRIIDSAELYVDGDYQRNYYY